MTEDEIKQAEPNDPKLVGILANLLQTADAMASMALSNTMLLGHAPKGVSAKMLVAGVMAEYATNPENTLEQQKAETLDVVGAIFDSMALVADDPSGKKIFKTFTLREILREATDIK